jgi:predicted acetyltransferase
VCHLCDISFLGFAEPQAVMLDGYADALRRGWSPNNLRDVTAEELADIVRDPEAFIAARRDDAPADGRTINLVNGRVVPRLPMRERWIWDGDFCGRISLRWQPGTDDLPAHVSGHIGYSVVPWKRGHGLAKRALRHMLSEAREVGLRRLEITTDPDNVASRKTIEANGGQRVSALPASDLFAHARDLYVIEL